MRFLHQVQKQHMLKNSTQGKNFAYSHPIISPYSLNYGQIYTIMSKNLIFKVPQKCLKCFRAKNSFFRCDSSAKNQFFRVLGQGLGKYGLNKSCSLSSEDHFCIFIHQFYIGKFHVLEHFWPKRRFLPILPKIDQIQGLALILALLNHRNRVFRC